MKNLGDLRLYASATERNRQPILNVLKQILPSTGNILEIASGTGEHAYFFAPQFTDLQWFPSDPDPQNRLSIDSWRSYCPTDNLAEAADVDVQHPQWEIAFKDSAIAAILAINLIHIAPWSACQGLIRGAGELLLSGGRLYLYGPYKEQNQPLVPSNQAFDQFLKVRNPAWGLRYLENVITLAETQNLRLEAVIQMPANNLSVIFQK
jgi:hypothetical protein